MKLSSIQIIVNSKKSANSFAYLLRFCGSKSWKVLRRNTDEARLFSLRILFRACRLWKRWCHDWWFIFFYFLELNKTRLSLVSCVAVLFMPSIVMRWRENVLRGVVSLRRRRLIVAFLVVCKQKVFSVALTFPSLSSISGGKEKLSEEEQRQQKWDSASLCVFHFCEQSLRGRGSDAAGANFGASWSLEKQGRILMKWAWKSAQDFGSWFCWCLFAKFCQALFQMSGFNLCRLNLVGWYNTLLVSRAQATKVERNLISLKPPPWDLRSSFCKQRDFLSSSPPENKSSGAIFFYSQLFHPHFVAFSLSPFCIYELSTLSAWERERKKKNFLRSHAHVGIKVFFFSMGHRRQCVL